MVEGTVLGTELSGSESVVHFEIEGQSWISQAHGVHPLPIPICQSIKRSERKKLVWTRIYRWCARSRGNRHNVGCD